MYLLETKSPISIIIESSINSFFNFWQICVFPIIVLQLQNAFGGVIYSLCGRREFKFWWNRLNPFEFIPNSYKDKMEYSHSVKYNSSK